MEKFEEHDNKKLSEFTHKRINEIRIQTISRHPMLSENEVEYIVKEELFIDIQRYPVNYHRCIFE
jgi:hypothetical protein